MSVRNLAANLPPRSVALMGASLRRQSGGRVIADNLLKGRFSGAIMPVNPLLTDADGVIAVDARGGAAAQRQNCTDGD